MSKPLPQAVKRFFDLYPKLSSAFEIYNGSVFASKQAALDSLKAYANKEVAEYTNPRKKGQKQDQLF